MKGEKMLIGLSYIDRKFIDESEKNFEECQNHNFSTAIK